MTELERQGAAAKEAAYTLSTAGTLRKNRVLEAIACALEEEQAQWLKANAEDLAAARAEGMRPSLLDRLALTPQRIAGIVDGVRQLASLPDPIGQIDHMKTRPNGLVIG